MDQIHLSEMDRVVIKKFWTKKKIVKYSLFAVILIAGLWFLLFNTKITRKVEESHISVAVAGIGEFKDYILTSGKVVPEKIIYLDAMEGGRVEEIFKDEGSMLKAGERILRLSNSNLQMNIMNREAELADQMNNLRNTRLQMEQNKLSLKGQLIENDFLLRQAQRDYLNGKELYDKKMVSKNEYLKIKEQYDYLSSKQLLLKESIQQDSVFRIVQIEQLNDSVKRLQQNLKMIREKLDGLTIIAPADGQLTSLKADIGEAKNTGERLGVLNMINNYKIEADINEYYLDKINTGLQAKAELENKSYPITLSKIRPEVQNGIFKVEFILNESIKDLTIGQTFIIRLELGETQQCMIIPKGTFIQYTGGQWIFVMDKNGKQAQRRAIKIGRQNPDYFEITSGLKNGEKVILNGYENYGKAEILKIRKGGEK